MNIKPLWSTQEQEVHDAGNTPIRVDVGIDLHPGMFEPHGPTLNKSGTPGQDIYAAGRKAHKAMYESLAQMKDVARVLRATAQPISADSHMVPQNKNQVVGGADGSMTQPLPRANEYAAAAEQAFKRGAAVADAAIKTVDLNGARLGEMLLQTLVLKDEGHPKVLAIAQEVRAHIKSLPADKRAGFVKGAVDAGDLPTVCAAMNAQPFLSGLKDNDLAVLRNLAAAKFAPLVYAQMGAAQAVKAKLVATRASFEKAYLQSLPVRSAKADAADAALAKLRAGGAA